MKTEVEREDENSGAKNGDDFTVLFVVVDVVYTHTRSVMKCYISSDCLTTLQWATECEPPKHNYQPAWRDDTGSTVKMIGKGFIL